ncbi:unnamed protein product, partial [Polarella glacialis]
MTSGHWSGARRDGSELQRNTAGAESCKTPSVSCTHSQELYALYSYWEVFRALAFTPFPKLFHGIVRLFIQVSAILTSEEEICDIGVVVHPVNTAPIIHVDELATGGLAVLPHKDVHLDGVILLSDPDEEDYSGGWFTQRVHSARLKVRVSCGTMSLLMIGEQDYVRGVQRGSIAGIEGLTFHEGDGSHDTAFDVTSTLENLNQQLRRLYYHSGANCRGENVTISIELDDLGNYGAGRDDQGNLLWPHTRPIV